MGTTESQPSGPDFSKGVAREHVIEGTPLLGRVGEEPVILVRSGSNYFAIGATCSHYGGPLAEGVVVKDTVRCPWHHACFSLRTGEALHAPAFNPLSSWVVEERNGKLFVEVKKSETKTARVKTAAGSPQKIVIVGGGAAGFAAAEMLRRERYQGSIVMLSNDDAPPVDRPNLSKDYLAGNAPEEWVPLRGNDFYAENGIELRLKTNVAEIDARSRQVVLSDGKNVPYDRLLLATGAEPIRLSIPGADQPQVRTLRTLADCRAIIERAKGAQRVLVLGASFIGLEVAASLRARGLEVHVAAPEKVPMERVMGPQLGAFIRKLHEEHGVIFHLEDIATAIEGSRIRLKSGTTLNADLVVAGIGVRPRIELAEKAGLTLDKGVAVNSYLETSVPEILAAGDITRWPDPHSQANIRVEHWVVAERQGQVAALNMLGRREKFTAVPFFWSQHYDVPINYVGHAESFDQLTIDGDIAAKDCMVKYKRGGRVLAAASIYRDLDSLKAEVAMEQDAMA